MATQVTDAQAQLGMMYQFGNGVPKDDAQAFAWIYKAALQGYASAQVKLGSMYSEGIGVPQDYTQALEWFNKAVRQGYVPALSNIGLMYEEGHGVLKDYVAAYALYNFSASLGDHLSVIERNQLINKMTSAQINAGQKLTREMQDIGVPKALDDHSNIHALKIVTTDITGSTSITVVETSGSSGSELFVRNSLTPTSPPGN